MKVDYDERTSLDIEGENLGNLLGWLFGTFLIVVAAGLIVGTWLWL
jgi:hypothetical protein